MINPHNISKAFSDLILNKFAFNRPSSINAEEQSIARNLYKCLNSILQSNSYIFESETTLDHDDDLYDVDLEDTAPEAAALEHPNDLTDIDYLPIDEHNLDKSFSLDYMKRAVEYFDEKDPLTGQRKRNWRSVKHIFRRIPNSHCLSRFRKYVENGGTKKQKVDDVDIFVYDQFENARHQLLPVHDIDLRRWSLKKARELNLHDFEASNTWLLGFKHRHRISSRKITQLVTRKHIESTDEINQSANTFVLETNKLIENYNSSEVLNTDQVGINLELVGNRTLTHMGEQSTWCSVRSTNNTTHSYTIQSTIALNGTVFGPLYVCLKEPSGRISDRIKKNLFNAKNIVLTCSKSGKLTSSLVTYWRDNCLVPNLPSTALLLVDSFPSHANPEVYKDLKNFEYRVIPPKTTSFIQPLDVYYNRQYKMILRRVYDHVRLDEIDINLAERNNIIKLQSLVHSQMCSTVFQPMIKYAWYKSRFLKDDPGPFQNVKQICFSIEKDKCDVQDCIDGPMIRCSWCQQELCFSHFFLCYHYH
ncbi:unnamed protein product [Rotaria magnacalcarata]